MRNVLLLTCLALCTVAAGCNPTTVSGTDAAAQPDAFVLPDAFVSPDASESDAATEPDAAEAIDAAVDLCADVDCADFGDACNVGSCDPADGTCVVEPRPDGTACDDGRACTADDVCAEGSCGGTGSCGTAEVTTTTPTPIRGNATGGTGYDDVCPAGEVLIGFNGRVGDSFDWIQTVCGVVSTTGGTVTITLGTELPGRGTDRGTPVTSTCPPNQVVVGLEGRAGLLVDQLALRCAPVTLDASGALVPGTATTLPAIGGTGGGPFPPTDCAAGELGNGLIVRAGGSVDGVGLSCATAVAD